jgi:hypothetical protein
VLGFQTLLNFNFRKLRGKVGFFFVLRLKTQYYGSYQTYLRNVHVGTRHKDRFHSGASMSVEAMVQGMIDDLNAALADAVKHDKGNSAAGTRVRKAMQDCKATAQDIRIKVQSDKN